jgi:hypothetical protein
MNGMALSFEGGGYVSIGPDPWSSITQQFTITFWAFGSDTLGNNWGFYAGDAAGRLAGCHIPWGDGSVYFDTTTGWERINLPLAAGSATGQWNHWTFLKNADNGDKKIYLNGELFHSGTGHTTAIADVTEFYIGSGPNGANPYTGLIDDFRLYDHALSEAEILGAMTGEPWPYVFGPVPKDGAYHEDTWVSMSWKPGDLAVSHDVYMGDNFDDVNNGAESAFIGNQGTTNLMAGFPGFPFPDGLIPGTTYYWRVDEVNDAEPNSPWKGPVWSFIIPPKKAYNANPAEGAKFIAPDAALSWTPGFGAKLHTVYFGENFDDVNNAAGGLPQGTVTYDPGTLEPDKTYYWRVDEFDAINTHKGNVWSFTVAGEGGGVRGNYYTGMDLGNLVLTRIDPQIDFSWGNGEPDPAVGADNFSCRWTGEVEAVFTETYTFYTSSDDGVRLWIDGQQIVNNWTDHATTENSGKIDLVAGNTYSLIMEYYENGGGAVAELRWESPRTPKQLIPQAALSLPIKASQANPSNGAVNVSHRATLSWNPGETAASHDVYFGTDADAVKNADTSSPEYKGNRPLDSESYDPGQLEWDTTYYWRVDEIEDGGTIQTGNVWSFTTANFLIVDDMESYNDIDEGMEGSNRIYNAWVDGYNDPTNGSQAGHLDAPFYEDTIVHSGNKSMPLSYDNTVGKSEATLTLTYPRDWTEKGVDTLAIWYIGDSANAAETMYVVLNGTAGVDNPDANAAQAADWTEWRISLSEFGINLTNVNTITLGFGNRTNPTAGGAGTVYFDDIRLYATEPETP